MKNAKILTGLLILGLFLSTTLYAQQPVKPLRPATKPAAPSANNKMSGDASAENSAPAVPASLKEASVQVVVGDVSTALDRFGAVASRFNPMFNGPFAKAMIGNYLKDPMLAGITPGKSILVSVFDSGPMVFAEVEAAQISAYKDSLKENNVSVEAAEGLLVFSPREGFVDAGVKMAAEAKAALTKEKRDPAVKVEVFLPRILAKYEPMIKQSLKQFTALAASAQQAPASQGAADKAPENTAQQMAMMQVFASTALTLARDIQSISLILAPDQKGGLGGEFEAKVKPGSAIAAFLTSPAGETNDLLRMLPGKGAIRLTTVINADAYVKLVKQYLQTGFQEQNTPKADQDAIFALITSGREFQGDAMAGEFLIPGQKGLSGVSIARGQASVDIPALIEKNIALVNSTPGLKGSRQEMTFKKNVRTYKGVAVHQLEIKQNLGPMQQNEDTKAFAEMFGSMKYEFGQINNLVVSTMGGQSLDPVIDAVQSKSGAGKPLAASAQFGPGARTYCDLDCAALLRFIQQFIPANEQNNKISGQMESAAKALQLSPAITGAIFTDASSARGKFYIPAEFFYTLGAQLQKAPEGGPQDAEKPAPGSVEFNGGAQKPLSVKPAAPAK